MGPIGDDLPSLIPLLFALIIFFSTFTFALNEFNLENLDINAKLEVLRVARVMRSNGIVAGYDDWQRLCDIVPMTAVKFKAGSIDLEMQRERAMQGQGSMQLREEEDYIENLGLEGGYYTCLSKNTSWQESEELSGNRVYSLIYPIALEYETVVLPVHLVVIAWQL